MAMQEHDSDTTTVSYRGVTVTRELAHLAEGIAGSLELRSDRDERIFVHVVDSFPSNLSVENAAFEPGNEPDIGDISDDRVSIRQTIADDTMRIRYGIFPSDSGTRLQWDPPSIRSVTDVEDARPTGDNTREAAGGSPDGVPDSLIARVQGMFRQHEYSSAESGRHGSDHDESVESRGNVDDQTEADTNGADEATAEETAEGDADESDEADTDEKLADRETGPATENDGDKGNDVATPGDPAEGQSSSGDAVGDQLTREEVGTNSSTSHVPTMTGGQDEDRAPGNRSDRSGDGLPRSAKLRIDRLSARVEEISAYTTALEGIIDEYGTGTEVIGRLEGDIDELEDSLHSLEDEVASVRQRHEESVDGIHAAVGRVDDEVERIDETVGHLETTVEDNAAAIDGHEEDVTALEDRFDGFADDVADLTETVETVEEEVTNVSADVTVLRDELETVREEIDTLHSFRKSLAEISHVNDE